MKLTHEVQTHGQTLRELVEISQHNSVTDFQYPGSMPSLTSQSPEVLHVEEHLSEGVEEPHDESAITESSSLSEDSVNLLMDVIQGANNLEQEFETRQEKSVSVMGKKKQIVTVSPVSKLPKKKERKSLKRKTL